MRILFSLAAVLAVSAAPQPAAAMTPGQAFCPAQLAPNSLGPMLTDEMMTFKEGQARNPAIAQGIKQVLDICMKREKVRADQEDDYTKYIIARIGHDDLARQLGKMKVPTAIIDRVFGIGPGKRNPTPDQISEDQFNTLVTELAAAGIKVDSLPENALTMMGAYVAVSGEMYRDMALIS